MQTEKYSFKELVDIEKLCELFEQFTVASGFTTGLVDQQTNEVLIATGWRDICTKFHRACKASEQHCKTSNKKLTTGLNMPGEIRIDYCKNGLIDGSTPIIIEEKHLANLFTGQVLFEPPDIERFKKQAKEFGYDETAYLAALKKVPVVDEDAFVAQLKFLAQMATMIAETGFQRLRNKTASKNTEKQKALLRSLLDTIPDLIFYKDQDSVYLGCNKAFEKFTGRKEKELIGLSDLDFFPKEQGEFFREKDWQMMTKGKTRRNEEWVEYPDGQRVLLDTLKMPYNGLDGKVLGLIGVSRDITKLKKAEEALKKEKIFSEKIVETAKAFIVGLDKDHIIRIFNRGAEQITGYKKEEVIGKDWFKIFFPKEMLDEMNKVWKDSWRVKSHSYINPILAKTGEEKIVSWQTTGMYDSDDVSKHLLLSIGEDITERKLAEQELRNEREKLFVTLRSIGDGVITTDTDGRVTLINSAAEQLSGWKQQEAVGRPLSEVFNIINEKTRLTCENPVNKVLASEKIIGLVNHTVLIARDGTRQRIADSAAPIHSSTEGKIIGVVLVFRDVTQEKKREAEFLKIKKLESLSVLAGGIAHDFNNILVAILGNISLAAIYIEKDHRVHSLLKTAEKASIRAKDLTQQLLTFAKGGDTVRETASIIQVITDSADFVLRGSNVKCRYAIPKDLWMVDINTGQMSQVIQNLVINARHAMPEGGEIKISCENIADIRTEIALSLSGEKWIKITMTDTGGGISKKYLDKIFDPYFSTKQEGSGLGLAITYSIINKHDGHIFVRSKSGKGTTFTIYLPASTEQKSCDAGEKTQKTEKAVRGTILVMDDEQMIQNLLKQVLSHFGHEVLQAKDGREAIAIFKEHHHSDNPVDVIIMDLTIPGSMGGKETITEILKIDQDAKAIVSSGYSNDPIMANYRQYGFKAVIGKPFEMAQLKKTVNSVLG